MSGDVRETPPPCAVEGGHCWERDNIAWPEGGHPEHCKHCPARRSCYPNPPMRYVYHPPAAPLGGKP